MLKGEEGQASQTNREGSPSVRGDREKKTKAALTSCHTLVGPQLDSNSHMLNVPVCFEMAPRILCSSLPSDIHHLA